MTYNDTPRSDDTKQADKEAARQETQAAEAGVEAAKSRVNDAENAEEAAGS